MGGGGGGASPDCNNKRPINVHNQTGNILVVVLGGPHAALHSMNLWII